MKRPYQPEIMLERPVRMKTAHDMKAGQIRVLHGIADNGNRLFPAHGISAPISRIASKRAKFAM